MSTSSRPTRRGLARLRPGDDPQRARFRQLLPYLADHKPAIAVVVVLSVIGAAASLAQPLLVSQLIARVQSGDELGPLLVTLVVLVIAAGLLSGLQHYLLQRTGTAVVYSARRALVRGLLRLPIREFDQRRTGDLVSRVGSDTTMLYAVLTQGLLDAVGGALLFVGALVAMLVIDPVLLGLTVLVIVVSMGGVGLLARRIRVASREQQERVGDLASSVERVLGAVRTVRASNATERETDAIDADARAAYRAGLKVAQASAFVVPIAGIAMQVSMLVVIGVGGFRVAAGDLTIAGLVAFILFLFMMIMPLGQALGAVTSVSQALGALGRIREITVLPGETDGDAAITPAAASGDAALAFEHVAFGYPGGDAAPREVLHDVSFTVPRGSRTAIVGPSGAGKSTTLALIERFYDPTAGVVRLGGADVRGLPREALRAQIGYVEQDAPVLAGSLRANLTLAAPDADDATLRRVLAAVNLTSVLERDPLGLDAPVGEDGVMLSGGERQRLAIARALVAAPPILLLDESTSSLDGLNEQLLREAIDAVAENRTLIVIAHRLSTVVDSDQIVVLDEGRVVGVGTHDELVESAPLYRDLARRQLLA